MAVLQDCFSERGKIKPRKKDASTHARTHTHTQRTTHCFRGWCFVGGGRMDEIVQLGELEHGRWHFGSDGGDDDDDGGMRTRDREEVGALYFDLEGRSGDVVVAPFYQQDVVATFAHQVVDLILVASGVLDEHFVAGSLWSVNANE